MLEIISMNFNTEDDPDIRYFAPEKTPLHIEIHGSYINNCHLLYLHRPSEEGPARKTKNAIWYCEHGHWHRYDGPARIDIFNKNDNWQWWIRGKKIDGFLYGKWLFESGMDIENLTEEDKLLIDLKWGSK